MNTIATSAGKVTVWNDTPRRGGASWAFHNAARLLRQLYVYALTRFVGFLGAVSTPGMKPIGILQAWALRRMGARCASHEVWIGPNVWFDYPQHVVFGRRIAIGGDARITARDTVVLGDDFLAAPGLCINTGGHDVATLTPTSAQVTIGAGVWCGVRVTICSGVTIGDDAIIGAGSVVVKNIPAAHIAVGTPCRPQRDIAHLRQNRAVLWSNYVRR